MTEISFPKPENYPELVALWRQAFGDTNEFIDIFMNWAFSPSRCRCILLDGKLVAALYWFDCFCEGKPCAYIYAVATDEAHRGKGLCHALMSDTHELLTQKGYACALLVPAQKNLAELYGGMGYEYCDTGLVRRLAFARDEYAEIRSVSKREYIALRGKLLPEGGVVQQGESIDFLVAQGYKLFAGENFVFAAHIPEDLCTLYVPEFLGDTSSIHGIVKKFRCVNCRYRIPGDKPYAMYLPLADNSFAPTYLGLAFD